MTDTKLDMAIEIGKDGPYHVTGGVPLKRVERVTDDEGRSVEWRVYEEISTDDEYWLCRCGHSTEKPFCSGAHSKVGFDGTETAPTNSYADRAEVLGGTNIVIHDDRSVCAHAGFCASKLTNVWKGAKKIDEDETMRTAVLAMIDNCPSGALSYSPGPQTDGTPEIWVMKDGSYIVRGPITVTRSDGQVMEIRNRRALCRCGASNNKPLCDGSHAESDFHDG